MAEQDQFTPWMGRGQALLVNGLGGIFPGYALINGC